MSTNKLYRKVVSSKLGFSGRAVITTLDAQLARKELHIPANSVAPFLKSMDQKGNKIISMLGNGRVATFNTPAEVDKWLRFRRLIKSYTALIERPQTVLNSLADNLKSLVLTPESGYSAKASLLDENTANDPDDLANWSNFMVGRTDKE